MSAVGLKGELKAFEKEFKAAHGRAPTKADIKARPDIAAKYKSYNARRSTTPVPERTASAATTTEPNTLPAPLASTSAQPQPFHTPRKQSSKNNGDGLPSLANLSPAKAKTAGTSHTRSPAGKAANPFAASTRDTPRTNARNWLSGVAPTPEKKRNLFSSWKDPQAMSAKPLALDEPILNLPDMSSFKASSAESTSATASTSSKSLPTFDPIKSKRSASTFMPFDAERKRGASLVSGADNDAEDHTKQPQAKRPKLSKKGAGSYAKDKGKEKMKSKGKNQVQSANDVTMDDAQQDDEADEALPASRLLEDGTLIMSYKDPDGKVHEMRVKDYKPYNHRIRNTTVDPDDLEEDVDLWQRHIAQQPSLDPGSSATSSMDVDASDIPAHLVSLLSLQTSPNKKHRREIARTKYKLYKQVLQEPSCRAAPAAGLLELAQENEDKAASTGWSTAAEGGNLGDDEGQLSGADDDWESEPEGWKELGGMDLAGFENDLDPW